MTGVNDRTTGNTVLDPTNESRPAVRALLERPESLKRGLIARLPSAINLEDLP